MFRRTLLLILIYFSYSWAQAQNTAALVLERNYLEIAKILSYENINNGACAETEAFTHQIVDAAMKAREYYNLNDDYNKAEGRQFSVDDLVKEALESTLALREILGNLNFLDVQVFGQSLIGVEMWGGATDEYGNLSSMEFLSKDHLLLKELEMDEGGRLFVSEKEATYELRLENIGIVMDITGKDYEESFVFRNDYGSQYLWYLVPESHFNLGLEDVEAYIDYPFECFENAKKKSIKNI